MSKINEMLKDGITVKDVLENLKKREKQFQQGVSFIERRKIIRQLFPDVYTACIEKAENCLKGLTILPGSASLHFIGNPVKWHANIYDYGILSRIDTTLTLSNAADSTNVQQSFSGMQSNSIQIVDYGIPAAGEHYVYIKYRKDGSAYGGNDSLQFKIRFE